MQDQQSRLQRGNRDQRIKIDAAKNKRVGMRKPQQICICWGLIFLVPTAGIELATP